MEKQAGGFSRSKRSKLQRTAVVTIRLDERLRYAAELISRRQRRTVSSCIEGAIAQMTEEESLRQNGAPVRELLPFLWDPLEADRFVKLALRFPELLSYEEQVLWKFITECEALWSLDATQRRHMGPEAEAACDFPLLRAHWDVFKQAARAVDPERLPPALYPRRGLQAAAQQSQTPPASQSNGVRPAAQPLAAPRKGAGEP